ncbi:class I SAM-dependent methyltransferase [Phyllobacterium ifriqiyense]|uniref:class I SAM-dependent methyltransferase n=1 Tax=Phyllobacterium ifriqiyense TaxID=314238 RepID=UPI003392CAE5
MNNNPNLSDLGYRFLDEYQLWSSDETASFEYSDGDGTENKIFDIIRDSDDVSLFSDQLRVQCVDWPTRYHLSPTRANLLRPLSHQLKGRILEIGSGCGAITRFLGENGGDVTAIEGSFRRAKITAARTRDLQNVTVIHDDFNNLNMDGNFDVVTLIGVLEYAGLFLKSADPVGDLLKSARRMLHPDGLLIVAIENQLGLKYLAGANEDHLNEPMVGVHDLYTKPGIETFGRADLQSRLQSAGFEKMELALPFPDYKFPSSIIRSETGALATTFNKAALAAEATPRDSQISSADVCFSLERAWGVVDRNNLTADLSNSFLFVVSPTSDTKIFADDSLAWHFSTERQPKYCKSVFFKADANGTVLIENGLINPAAEAKFSDLPFEHTLRSEHYQTGETLGVSFVKIVQKKGWTAKEISDLLRCYYAVLIDQQSLIHESQKIDLSLKVPGYLLDTVPQNIILYGEQSTAIDQEWSAKNPISLAYLMFRALTTMFRMVVSIAPPAEMRWLNQVALYQDVFSLLDFDFNEAQYLECAQLEADFMTFASGLRTVPIPYEVWKQHRYPNFLDRADAIHQPYFDTIPQLEELAGTYIRQIKWLEGENANWKMRFEKSDSNLQQLQDSFDVVNSELATSISNLRQLEGDLDVLQRHHDQAQTELKSIKQSRAWRTLQFLLWKNR